MWYNLIIFKFWGNFSATLALSKFITTSQIRIDGLKLHTLWNICAIKWTTAQWLLGTVHFCNFWKPQNCQNHDILLSLAPFIKTFSNFHGFQPFVPRNCTKCSVVQCVHLSATFFQYIVSPVNGWRSSKMNSCNLKTMLQIEKLKQMRLIMSHANHNFQASYTSALQLLRMACRFLSRNWTKSTARAILPFAHPAFNRGRPNFFYLKYTVRRRCR